MFVCLCLVRLDEVERFDSPVFINVNLYKIQLWNVYLYKVKIFLSIIIFYLSILYSMWINIPSEISIILTCKIRYSSSRFFFILLIFFLNRFAIKLIIRSIFFFSFHFFISPLLLHTIANVIGNFNWLNSEIECGYNNEYKEMKNRIK